MTDIGEEHPSTGSSDLQVPKVARLQVSGGDSSTDEGSPRNDDNSSATASDVEGVSGSGGAVAGNVGGDVVNPAATPADPTDWLPSLGSIGHFSGQCSRCCFFPKGRCQNGASCQFCHLDHARLPRRRGKKQAAANCASASGENDSTCADSNVAQQTCTDNVMQKTPASLRQTFQARPVATIPNQSSSGVAIPCAPREVLRAKGLAILGRMETTHNVQKSTMIPCTPPPGSWQVPEDRRPSWPQVVCAEYSGNTGGMPLKPLSSSIRQYEEVLPPPR